LTKLNNRREREIVPPELREKIRRLFLGDAETVPVPASELALRFHVTPKTIRRIAGFKRGQKKATI
jgi:DNA invertase Pin-like site-specific DNA recombinase